MANHTIQFPRTGSTASPIKAALAEPAIAQGLALVPSAMGMTLCEAAPMDSLAQARAIVAQVERELEQQTARARSLLAFPVQEHRLRIVRDTPLVVARRVLNSLLSRVAS